MFAPQRLLVRGTRGEPAWSDSKVPAVAFRQQHCIPARGRRGAAVTARDDQGGDLRQLFFETAQEVLQVLNEDALKLEQSPADAECWRSIRRAVHTIKGDAAACGFADIAEFAHEAEQAFEAAAPELRAEFALAAADVFIALLNAHRSGTPARDVSAWRQRVQSLRLRTTLGSKQPAVSHLASLPTPAAHRVLLVTAP